MTKKSLVFSGVQPTGNLHLGNYLGAIKNWVKLQHQHPSIFCIVDLHAITVFQEPAALREATFQTLATYIACGIDPVKNTLFAQSTVSGHSELAWILSCHTPLGWLNRMTQFKDKGVRGITFKFKSDEDFKAVNKALENETVRQAFQRADFELALESGQIRVPEKVSSLGLFSYPTLMAADILLYKATHVPVGEDQKQHLELARDIAGAFNRAYKTEFFPLPEPLILGEATRVMSLGDGTKKMSKSDPSDLSRVNLTDDAAAIDKKFKKATSDSTMGFESLEGRPEALNLLTIYASLADIPLKEAQNKFISAGYGGLKKELAALAVEKISPISAELNRLMKDRPYLEKILKAGAEKAGEIAEKNMKDIRNLVGFVAH